MLQHLKGVRHFFVGGTWQEGERYEKNSDYRGK